MPKFAISSVSRKHSEHVLALKPFTTHGNMYGQDYAGTTGMLSDHALRTWQTDHAGIKYAVYSYRTPIAWVRADGTWVVVDNRFSSSTGKHQSALYFLKDPVRVGFAWSRVTEAQGRLLRTLVSTAALVSGSDKRSARILAERGYALDLGSNVYAINPVYAARCA